MVHVCCVQNCNNRSTRESDRIYFSIPHETPSLDDKSKRLLAERRAKWIDAIKRQKEKAWEAKDYHKVCSDHFISGLPSKLNDVNSPDWIPSLKMGETRPAEDLIDGPEEDGNSKWQNWENFVRRITFFLRNGVLDETLTKSEQRAIHKAAQTYYLESGVLYHQKSGKPLRVALSESEHLEVIGRIHVSESAGNHWGINATMERVSAKYFWRGVKQDIIRFISNCNGCQRSDKQKEQAKTEQEQSVASVEENRDNDDDADDDCIVVDVKGETSKGGTGGAAGAMLKIADVVSKEKKSEEAGERRDDDEGEASREIETSRSTRRSDADKKAFVRRKKMKKKIEDVRGVEKERAEDSPEPAVGRATGGDGKDRTEDEKDAGGSGERTDEVWELDEAEGTFVKVDPSKQVRPEDATATKVEAGRAADPPAAHMIVVRTAGLASAAAVPRPAAERSKNVTVVACEMTASATILRIVDGAARQSSSPNVAAKQQRPSSVTNVVNILPKPNLSVVRRDVVVASPKPTAVVEISFEKNPATKSGVVVGGGGTVASAAAQAVYRSVAWSLHNVGIRLVRQQVYRDLVDIQETKEEQNRLDEMDRKQLEKLKGYYDDLRRKNRYLAAPRRRCQCGYRVGSRQELELHQEYGHGWENGRFDCCLCKFASKAYALFSGHMLKEHGRRARLQLPSAAFACPFCPFEHRHSTKVKMLRHVASCGLNFKIDQNLAVRAIDSDIPVTAPKPVPPPHPPKPLVPATVAVSVATPTSSSSAGAKNQVIATPGPPSASPTLQNSRSLLKKASTTVGGVSGGPATMQPAPSLAAAAVIPAKPLVVQFGFEICEICGGYVKDRQSLQIHMRAAHRVHVSAACMKDSDPLLACKSCPDRFWSGQALELHTARVHDGDKLKPGIPGSGGAPGSADVTPPISVCPLCKRTRLTDVLTHLAQQHRITLLDMFTLRYCALCLLELHTEKAFEDHMIGCHASIYPDRVALMRSVGALMPTTSRGTALVPRPAALLVALVNRNRPASRLVAGRAPPPSMFSCPVCRTQFANIDELSYHFERFHAYRCCRCEHRCSSAEYLRRHFRAAHASSDDCPVCGERVAAGRPAVEHFERHHLRECSVRLDEVRSEDGRVLLLGGTTRDDATREGGGATKRRRPSSVSDGSGADTASSDDGPDDDESPTKRLQIDETEEDAPCAQDDD